MLAESSLESRKHDAPDDRPNADADVAAYAQAVAAGAKFVEKDSGKKKQVEEAERQLDSPFAMGLEKKELDKLKKLAQQEKTHTYVKNEDQIAAEIGDEGLDITDMLQIDQSIHSIAASNTVSTSKSVQSVGQKAEHKATQKSGTKSKDNPWDTMNSMNSMMTSVIDKATPKAPKNTANKRLEA